MAAIIPYLPAIAGATSSLLGGIFAKQPKETKIQKQQRELVDQLLGSLKGNGPYSALFQPDEEAFQKSIVEPAKSIFRNQIVPQIQQGYVGGTYGQQRGGTGMEDTLARAGVDLDQLINQQYLQFQQGAQNRQTDVIGRILGQGEGVQKPESFGSQLLSGLGGYLTQGGAEGDIANILSGFSQQKPSPEQNSLMDTYVPQREGFEREPQYYDYRTGVMS